MNGPPKSIMAPAVRRVTQKAERKLTAQVVTWAEKEAPAQVEAVKGELESLARRRSARTRQAVRTLSSSGAVLPAGSPLVKGASKVLALATALTKPLRQAIAAGVEKVVQAKQAKFGPLLARLGNPSGDEWAAMLQKATYWAELEARGWRGRSQTSPDTCSSGFEKLTATFAQSAQGAARKLAEHNRELLGEAGSPSRIRIWRPSSRRSRGRGTRTSSSGQASTRA